MTDTTDTRMRAAHTRASRSPAATAAVALAVAAVLVLLVSPLGVPPYPLVALPACVTAYLLGPRIGVVLAVLCVGLVRLLSPVVDYTGERLLGTMAELSVLVSLSVAAALAGRFGDTERRLRTELQAKQELELRLVRRDASLNQVLANLPAVLWMTDDQLRITFAQGRGFSDHGIDPESLIGKRLDQTPAGVAELIDAHQDALDGLTPSPVELIVNDRIFEAHVVAQARDGVVESVIGVGIDLTDRVEAQSSLELTLERERELSTELRHVDDMKNGFLQAVSHELRTPLTALSGFTATLRRAEDRLSTEQRALVLDRIHRNAEKLDRLLSDLLDVDRLSRGVVGPQRTYTDVGAVVLHLLDETDFGAHPLRTAIESTRAYVDAPKVERIVENLLHNAMRHTPPTTPILVRVRRTDEHVLIQVEQEEVEVADELKERIFQPFAQGPVARWSATPGTGIGLALVTQFAALHGGRAWVEDREGGGAIFSVSLPDETVPDGVQVGQTGAPTVSAAAVAPVGDGRVAAPAPPSSDQDVPLRR